MPVRSHPLHRQWLARRRRLRRWLRPLPRRANVARYPVIKWFAEAARKRPYLWSFKRAQVMPSLYVGAVLALMPVYGLQVAIGLALAILVRGNLTVMIALQMLTNPLTLGPIYLGTHALGQWLIALTGYGEGVGEIGTRVNALVVGGLVALETAASYAGLPPGRIVCLGSPLAGSSAARGMARRHLGFWLGRSGTLLRSGLHALPEGREVGVIAGSKPMGLGRYFGDFDGLNDGTVAVWETRLPGLADHRVLPDSHTGLLLDPRVGDLAAGFLRDGRFPA